MICVFGNVITLQILSNEVLGNNNLSKVIGN